jgi:hypothetical protein
MGVLTRLGVNAQLKKEMKKDLRKKLPKFPTGMFVNTHDKAAFLSRFFKFLTTEAEFFAHAAVQKFIEPRVHAPLEYSPTPCPILTHTRIAHMHRTHRTHPTHTTRTHAHT